VADAWIALARDGDPNHPGLPEWPRYGPDGATLVFADAPRLEYRPAMVSP